MILQWFDAQEATAAGTALADHFLPDASPSAAALKKAGAMRDWREEVPRFRQRVAREAGRLKLNLFKRAKLLNSFKWRLLENGFDPKSADELTQVLVMQLLVKGGNAGLAQSQTVTKQQTGKSLRRLPILLGEADALFAQRNYAETAKRLRAVISLDERQAPAFAKLGTALCCMGQYAEGEVALRRAIELKPSLADAYLNLGTLLRDKGEFAASEAALRRATKLDPANAVAKANLGVTLGMQARLAEARECFEKALRVKPSDAEVLSFLGWLAGMEGNYVEAEKRCRAALDSNPQHAGSWALLAKLRRMTAADKDWLEGVERTLAGGVQSAEESKLRYSMGKYFDDLGKYPRAFEQYKRANELQKLLTAPYDRSARTKVVDETIATYTRESLAPPPKGASQSTKPLFVTGMMRSGTSLVEQIIASHPQAMGAGELDFWNTNGVRLRETLRGNRPDEALTRKLAEAYLRLLEAHSASSLRVVDKSTFNTDHLGLIHQVLPQARIICLQRDPIDNCLSCYFTDFANAATFTMDLQDLAHYYREHHRLVSHWRSVLPQEALLVVPYAALIADPETWSRRVIEFIGLEWDARCLRFYETKRAVLTASSWQVRQQIYSQSQGRWRNYEKFIGPLLKLRDLEST